jgi:tetratricopeptide (TPR) repeat protein
VAVLRQVRQRYPADFWVNHQLALGEPESEQEIRYLTAATALRPQSPGAHSNLGFALYKKGRLDEAIAEWREAIRLGPDYAMAHNNLGVALMDMGKVDEAIVCYDRALALNPKYGPAHNNLCNALTEKGKVDDAIICYHKAIAAYRVAIGIKKDYLEAHNNLGTALLQRGRLDEAIACFTQAVEIDAKCTRAHSNLDLARKFAKIRDRLPLVLRGKDKPNNADEWLIFADFCQQPSRQQYAAAVRFYEQAFAADSKVAENLHAGHRYDAACDTALASCGQGKDAAGLDEKERSRLRKQALDWLRADLNALNEQLKKDPESARPLILKQMQHWQKDTDFAALRGRQALAKLPEGERVGWEKLWAEVADTLTRARGSIPACK